MPALLSVGPLGILRLQQRVYVLEKLDWPIGFVEYGDSGGRRCDGRREQDLRLWVMIPDPERQREATLIAADIHVEQDERNPAIGAQGSAGVGLAEGLDDIEAPLA